MDNTPPLFNDSNLSLSENILIRLVNSTTRNLNSTTRNLRVPQEENNIEENNIEENSNLNEQENNIEENYNNQPPVRITPLRNINSIRNIPIFSVVNTLFSVPHHYENNDILTTSLNEKSAYKKVISDEKKNDLKEIYYKESSKKNNTCPIFQIEFSDDDKIIELPCKHCFTPDGIKKWLSEEQPLCPVCRFEFDSKEVKRENEEQEQEQEQTQRNNHRISESRQALIRSLTNLANNNNYIITSRNILYQEEQNDLQQAIYESIRQNNDTNEN